MRRLVLVVVLAFACGGDEPRSPDVTPQPPRPHEVLTHRPSGFWTSNRPATHGAYRWRLLAIGLGIAGITGFAVVRLVRRANGERASETADRS